MKSKFYTIYEQVMQTLISEGGNAVKGFGIEVTKIAKENIKPTLDYIDNLIFSPLNIPNDCWSAEIGSTGKKDFSGDLDVAIDINKIKEILGFESADDAENAIKDQLSKQGINFTTKNGINCVIPIQGSQEGEYVQLDIFKTTNLEFTKFAKFGPSPEESKYKGAIRSEILRQMIKIVSMKAEENVENGIYTAPDGIEYPAKMFTQISFCNDGAYETHKSFLGKTGKTLANPIDNKLNTKLLTQSPQELIDILFGKDLYKPSDFNSFESIWNNVIFSESFPYKEKIYQIILRTYNVLKQNKNAVIPQEMLDYLGK